MVHSKQSNIYSNSQVYSLTVTEYFLKLHLHRYDSVFKRFSFLLMKHDISAAVFSFLNVSVLSFVHELKISLAQFFLFVVHIFSFQVPGCFILLPPTIHSKIISSEGETITRTTDNNKHVYTCELCLVCLHPRDLYCV